MGSRLQQTVTPKEFKQVDTSSDSQKNENITILDYHLSIEQ